MKISIFGLGYVGTVTAGCLVDCGNEIIGVDNNALKVDLINQGKSPVIEKDIGDIVSNAVDQGHLTATMDVGDAIMQSELSIICVGTPSQMNGDLNLSYIRRIAEEIGVILKEKAEFHVIVVRSTILPGRAGW